MLHWDVEPRYYILIISNGSTHNIIYYASLDFYNMIIVVHRNYKTDYSAVHLIQTPGDLPILF